MARRKLKETNRDKSTLIQGWFNPAIPEENEVLIAIHKIREKHPNMTNKAIIADSIMFAASRDGIEIQTPVSGTQIMKTLKKILAKMDGLVSGGHITTNDAAGIVELAQQAGIRYEDLDPISRSLARNYTGFDIEDEE